MTSRDRAIPGVMFIANVAWLGGLLRLAVEGISRVLPEIAPDASDQRTVVVAIAAGVAITGIELVLLWRWSWYRGVLRETQEDIRSLWSLPLVEMPRVRLEVRRAVASATVVLLPAVAVAALLPGPVPSAIAMVLGLAARVAVAIVTAMDA
jgi:hypothetical protein